MRLVTYQHTAGVGTSAGVLLENDVVVDLSVVLTGFASVEGVLRAGALPDVAQALDRIRRRFPTTESYSDWANAHGQDAGALQLLPPVLCPSKVIGVGMNYRSFIEQLGEPTPEHPSLFHKTSSALRGHRQPIVVPANTDQAVPEGELAVVIGAHAAGITPEQAPAHIAGYTCANDISARNLEFQTSQWTNGKMLATFAPLGPALVTPDEIDDVGQLEVRTILNGHLIQQGNTRDMIFDVHDVVSRISLLVPLEIGDVILTGTPSDLGEVHPPVFLTTDDTIEVHVKGVGVLRNDVVAAHLTPRHDSLRKDQPHELGVIHGA